MRKLIVYLISVLGFVILITSCASVGDSAFQGLSNAINNRVENEIEREVSGMLSGYTDAMLYQLAYSQAFLVGGYGVTHEDFSEGEGSTWRVESGDGTDNHSYTSERALLKINEDGSNWWYLKYQPEDDEAIEYEIKMTRDFDPLEMYYRNPDSGDVTHHIFENYSDDSVEEDLEEEGFSTSRFYVENWEDYYERDETIRVGSTNYNTSVLYYKGTEEQGDEDTEIRWWVSEDVPGDLLRYEMTDLENDGRVVGEMTDYRTGYTPKFAEI